MYSDKITLFNHYKSRLGDMWYPTVIDGVNLLIDKAAIMAKYGAESKDNAILNIHYQTVNGQILIDGKPYLPPKEWERQTNDKLPESITFASGKDFDFFMLGDYGSTAPIQDSQYDVDNGFYNYMNDNYDYVFAITSVGGPYTTIPTFQIMGA